MADHMTSIEFWNTTPEVKTCRVCGETKPTHEFHKGSSARVINGKFYREVYRSECKSCRSTNGDAHSSEAAKLMNELNMTYPPKGTPCDCCGKVGSRLVFDHCHDTKQFRGWLCYQCNSAIGNLGDTLEGVSAAVTYLSKSKK